MIDLIIDQTSAGRTAGLRRFEFLSVRDAAADFLDDLEKRNEQTAERILQAMDNKENQTRARVNKANKGDKSVGSGRSTKRW